MRGQRSARAMDESGNAKPVAFCLRGVKPEGPGLGRPARRTGELGMELSPTGQRPSMAVEAGKGARKRQPESIVQEAKRGSAVVQLLRPGREKRSRKTGRAERAALVGDDQRTLKRLLSADHAPRLPPFGSAPNANPDRRIRARAPTKTNERSVAEAPVSKPRS